MNETIKQGNKKAAGFRTQSESGVTLSVVFDQRRVKNNGLYPVKFCATYQGKRVYFPSVNLAKEDWSALTEKKSVRRQTLKDANNKINKEYDRIWGIISKIIEKEGFTFAALNTRMSRGTKNGLLDAFKKRENKLRDSGNIGTADWYKYAAKSIGDYSSSENLKFADITPTWLGDYEKHLRSKGKSDTTISMYMRAIRAIMKPSLGPIITESQYPFGKGKYQISEGSGGKTALTLDQISEILKIELPPGGVGIKYRDLWYFSYLCNGINMSDLLRLRYKNIENGEIWYSRQKTKNTNRKRTKIPVPILPDIAQIIDKYGNPDRKPENYIFPYLNASMTPTEEKRIIRNLTRAINQRMRRIGNKLGYGNISTYVARHSFATIQKRSGASIAYISECLGHSNPKTTDGYLAYFEQEQRAQNALNLIPKK